jgi:uncharacterized protein (DUF433 family)
MSSPTDVKYIVRDEAIYGGKPRIEGHRIAVHDIVAWHRQGASPEAMAQDYGLRPAQVYAALAYYYDHQDEIDREIAEEDAAIKAQAAADASPVAQRVRQAIAQRRNHPTHA